MITETVYPSKGIITQVSDFTPTNAKNTRNKFEKLNATLRC